MVYVITLITAGSMKRIHRLKLSSNNSDEPVKRTLRVICYFLKAYICYIFTCKLYSCS